jgi:hypothetical protein
MTRNVLIGIFIFVVYPSMQVWSVAFIGNNELSEHHSWCYIICLLNKNGGAILELNNKINWKILPFIFLNPMV